MNKVLSAIVVLLVIIALPVNAETLIYKSIDAGGRELNICVDSVQFRNDVTRVYGYILGAPHRAHRIDKLAMSVGNTVSHISNDIDGIDYGRWFQWEDDPSIVVEIDFPVMKPCSEFIIEAETPKGNFNWKFKSTPRK